MASESMRSTVSSEQYAVNHSKLSNDCAVNDRNCSIQNSEPTLGISMKSLEKREIHSYRNLPGLLATASSADSVDIRNTEKNEELICSATPTSEDNVNTDHGKRKRVHHDYRKLSNSGYVDDAMGRRYSSSTSSASESDTPPKVLKLKTNIKCPSSHSNTLNGGNAGEGRQMGSSKHKHSEHHKRHHKKKKHRDRDKERAKSSDVVKHKNVLRVSAASSTNLRVSPEPLKSDGAVPSVHASKETSLNVIHQDQEINNFMPVALISTTSDASFVEEHNVKDMDDSENERTRSGFMDTVDRSCEVIRVRCSFASATAPVVPQCCDPIVQVNEVSTVSVCPRSLEETQVDDATTVLSVINCEDIPLSSESEKCSSEPVVLCKSIVNNQVRTNCDTDETDSVNVENHDPGHIEVTVATSNWQECAPSVQEAEDEHHLVESPGTPLMDEQPYSPHLGITTEVLTDNSDKIDNSQLRMKCEEEPKKVTNEDLTPLQEESNIEGEDMANACGDATVSDKTLEERSFTPPLPALNHVHSNISPKEATDGSCKSDELKSNILPSGSALELNSENLLLDTVKVISFPSSTTSTNSHCEVAKVSQETADLVPESSTCKLTDIQGVPKTKSSGEEPSIGDTKSSEVDRKAESSSSKSVKNSESSGRDSHRHHSSSSRTYSSHRSSRDKRDDRHKRDGKSDSGDSNSKDKRSRNISRDDRKDHSRGSSSSDGKNYCVKCQKRSKIKKASIGVQCRRERFFEKGSLYSGPKIDYQMKHYSLPRPLPYSQPGLENLKYGRFIHVETYPNGGATIVHMYQDEIDCLNKTEMDELAQEYFKIVFGEDEKGFAYHVMGIVHDAAAYLPDLLNHMADNYPSLTVKNGILGRSSDIETTTMAQYRDQVCKHYANGTVRYGPLHQISLVGTVHEEVGGFFPDFLARLEENPFLKMTMPWGQLSVVQMETPQESNDGPILWIRPGEQLVPTAEMGKSPAKRRRTGINELRNLQYLPRLSEAREYMFEDRTKAHADHVGHGLDRMTTAAVGAKTEKIEREMTIEEVEQKAAEIFPEDVLSGLCDTNWKTRLSSVETFVQVINGMEPSEIPSQVMIQVLNKKPGLKDTNFQVLKARLEALKLLAEISKLSSTSVEICVVDVAEKLGDPKNGVLAAEVLTSLAEASKLDLVGTLVLDFAFNQKSPKVQQEALNWLSNAIREFGLVIQPKKIIDKVKKALAATTPTVRTAGIQFVGTLYVYMGSQLTMLFENEKASLKQLIQAEFDKHAGESPPIPTRGASRNVSEDQDEDGSSEQLQEQQMNVRELMPRVDISSHITESLLEELKDKNWKVRNEAFQKLENILKENKFVTSNLGELPPVLAQRILDSNSNIAKTAIAFSQTLGIAMGSQCKNQVHVIFPSLLQSLSDNKQWIRSGAISCMNAWGEQCGFKEFFKNEMIADVLKSDSPNLRTELWGWLAEKLTDLPPKSIPKEELLLCLPHLYANLEDRNADVRKNAQECILPFMLHLNYTTMAKATEKMKPASKSTIVGLLEKVRGSVPLKQPSAPAKAVNEDENTKTVKTAGAKAAAANKTAGKGKPVAKGGSRKKDDEADTSPVLQNNNMKHQRTIDEQKLKVLKWNFTTPREEFVELLKDQMTNAGVNKSLLANMFHSDFRYHLKAIDTLNEDLPSNGGATMANLDLILKWMTLRFFDTNPSVLIKGLEYLQLVFTMLIEEEYNMFENEAASFIPYLILKIGDPKDAVRNSVRGLFKQMEKVYPLTKLFGYIMEGLKSKNARQRTECLDLLGSLIEVYGVSVCNPSPSAALKEIAKQISDRDNSVRNAALNCVVQAYFLEGEKVYKMIGQVSDKDLCLLEERIKRAAKNRPARPSVAVSKTQQVPQQQQVQQPVESPPSSKVDVDENNQDDYSDNEEVAPAPVMRNIVPKPRPVSGPFGLDSKLLEQIEKETLDLSAPKLENFDLAEIWESPVNIPKTAFCGLGAKRDSSLPTALITAQPRQLDDCTTSSQVVDLAIAKVASSDLNEAWQANVQMEEMLNSDRANLLLGREDSLIKSCCVQLKLLYGNFDHDANLPKGYRTLLMLIIEFFDHKNLGNNVSEDALIELVENLLVLLVSGRVESFGEGHCYVRILNTILLRIIQFANPTNTTCTFLQILHKCAGSNNLPARFEELTLKCLWRLIKFLPDWEGELDILMVLQKIHNFLKDYPSSVWKKRECDNPIRTVKTILHTITKMVGGERILQYVTRIDNLSESELQPYLHRLVKKIKVEESKSKSKKPPHRLSKVTHEQLSEIFKKIGARETSQEGLELLYDFKEQHPEADVEPFLKKSSQFFQDYIERNLKIIGEKRKANDDNCYIIKSMSTTTSMSSLGMQESGGPGTPFSEAGDATILPRAGFVDHRNIHSHMREGDSEQGTKGAEYYLERLRTLQAQAGINPSSALDALKMQNNLGQGQITHDQDLNKQQIQDDLEMLQAQAHNTMSHAGDNVTAAGIESLRKRLEAFKTSKR